MMVMKPARVIVANHSQPRNTLMHCFWGLNVPSSKDEIDQKQRLPLLKAFSFRKELNLIYTFAMATISGENESVITV